MTKYRLSIYKSTKNIPFFPLAFVILMNSLFSCNVDDQVIGYVNYEPHMVVEGSIENDQVAIVMLSWSAPFDQKMDTAFLFKHIVTNVKVSVSDGEKTEILTPGIDLNYLPPIYYRSNLKGEIGKTYRLTIEYEDKTMYAETFIPEPVELKSHVFIKENPSDTVGYIRITFNNTSDVYYQAATRVDKKENVYTPCLFGNFKSDQYEKNKLITLQINKGPILYPERQIVPYFIEGDIIYIKFKTMPKHGYDFWNSWQNDVVNGQNPIFPSITSLKSNIEGGIGIWCGYGSYTYRVDTK